jgi:hypothetical protein
MNDTASTFNLSKYGNQFNNSENFKEGLANWYTNNNLLTSQQVRNEIDEGKGLWPEIAQKYNDAPISTTDPQFFQDYVANNPKVAQFFGNENVGAQGIGKIAQSIGQKIGVDPATGIIPDFTTARMQLNNIISDSSKSLGNAVSQVDRDTLNATKNMAASVKQAIDDHALSLDPNFAQMKKDYPYILAAQNAAGREATRVENPGAENSNTMQKMMMGSAMGALGAEGSNAAFGTDFNPLAIAGVGLGAPFAERFASKIATGTLGAVGQGLKKGLDALSPEFKTGVGNAVNKGFSTAFGNPGAIASGGVTMAQKPVAPPVDKTAPSLVAPQNIQAPPAPESAPQVGGAPVSSVTGQAPAPNLPPGYSPQLQNPAYAQSVQSRLQQIYSTQGYARYLDFPSFVEQVAQRTQGFDPKYMSHVFYADPAMQSKYEKDQHIAEQLKNIGPGGINEVINDTQLQNQAGTFFTGLAGGKGSDQAELDRKTLESLVNGGKEMNKAESQSFHEELAHLYHIPEAQRLPEFIKMLKSNHDIDLPELMKRGVL